MSTPQNTDCSACRGRECQAGQQACASFPVVAPPALAQPVALPSPPRQGLFGIESHEEPPIVIPFWLAALLALLAALCIYALLRAKGWV